MATIQATSSNQPKYVYHTAKELYYSPELKNKKDRLIYNIYGKFVDRKHNLIILEDFTLDCVFHVRINSEIEEYFEKCFYPWFVFRLHRAECTASTTNYRNNPKTIYFNLTNKESINWIVAFSLISKDNELIKVHKSKNPTFEEHDNRLVNNFRDIWSNKLNSISISDLKYLKERKVPKASFLAQIIEIKQIASHKIILKVWDGSKPEFNLRLPIDQQNDINEKEFKVQTLIDSELNELTRGRQCYIYLVGEKQIDQLQFKKPGNYALFLNAKIYDYASIQPPVFRIELNDNVIAEKSFVRIFDLDTKIGNFLNRKLMTYLDNVNLDCTNNDFDIQSTINSFDVANSRNQIFIINNFNEIKESNVNYQVFCNILDLFPIEYTIYDLIILKCSNCNLEDSVQNLFNTDLENLRDSVNFFRISNKLTTKVNCPSCFKCEAIFKFSIVFLLEDKQLDRCITIMQDDDAQKLFKTTAIDVLASKDKEFVFLNQLNELRQLFNNLNSNRIKRSVIIKKDNEIYKIKTIIYQRDHIR